MRERIVGCRGVPSHLPLGESGGGVSDGSLSRDSWNLRSWAVEDKVVRWKVVAESFAFASLRILSAMRSLSIFV